MMVFVDSWAWVALALRRDEHHAAATKQHALFRQQKRRYVTSSFVLSEVTTLLYRLLPPSKASKFIEAILMAAESGEYQLIHVTEDQFQSAWQLRLKYADKPDISFVDFTSMALMHQLGITDVFTGDSHFRQVNLGYSLYPESL